MTKLLTPPFFKIL